MSARSMTVGPSPLRSTPTTPVPPTPLLTSQPAHSSCSAALAAGALLVVRELRMGMEVAVEGLQGFDDCVESVEDLMCGRVVAVAVVTVSPELFGLGRAGRVDHSTASSRRLVLATSRTSSPRPDRTLRVAHSVNPLACSAVILGGIDSS